MERTPFMRKMSAPFSCNIFPTHACTRSRSRSPVSVMLRLVTVLSCSCSPSVLRNSGSISNVRLRSKPLMFRTLSTDTLDCSERRRGANLFMERKRPSTRSRSVSVTRSTLLTSKRSAKATCSTASFSAPSGFSSSRCCSICLASMSVTIPSRRQKDFASSSTKKVWATGAGSAKPVVSMIIPSSFSLPDFTRLESFFSTTIRSCRTVQQMHPFIISIISSSACILVFLESNASSIPTSPNSFSITANFLPCASVRMWFSSVVLPLPKKPVRMVTGTRSSLAMG
mmetsp:Transcript_59455/g.98572  ORF Transcript_59455/g.98572 Transcript_59455/m.98572 type:complete len:284 (-) Transcript_59455:25-876(-)